MKNRLNDEACPPKWFSIMWKIQRHKRIHQTGNSHFCTRTFFVFVLYLYRCTDTSLSLNKRKPVLVLFPNFLCFKAKNTHLFMYVFHTPSVIFAQLKSKSLNSMVHFNWKHSWREANCFYTSEMFIFYSAEVGAVSRQEGLSSESSFWHKYVATSLLGYLLNVSKQLH